MSAIANLKRAIKKRRDAEDMVEHVLREQFPVNAFVAFVGNSGNTLLGRVVMHGRRDRIMVENAKTGRAYWIYAWRLQ